ncbi:Fic/DOC family protein [Pasteurella multocida]
MRYGGNDPHIYENGVLKNKLGVKTQSELDDKEKDITAFRIAQLRNKPIQGNFDLKHLQDIHRFIFSPIYDWAGEIRDGTLSKGDTVFTYPERIAPEINKLLANLKTENYLEDLPQTEVTKRLAYYLGELNVHHPFREGNGRTQRVFISDLAERAGYKLNLLNIPQNEMIEASIRVYRNMDYSLLEKLIASRIEPLFKMDDIVSAKLAEQMNGKAMMENYARQFTNLKEPAEQTSTMDVVISHSLKRR